MISVSDFIQLGILLAAVFTVVFSVHSHNRMMRSNLILEFSRRYQEIMLAMPADESKAEKHILLYFDLCSEEYRMKEQLKVDSTTWELWKDGMRDCFRHHPAFRKVWEKHRNEYRSDDFYMFIDDLLNGTSADRTPAENLQTTDYEISIN